MGQFRLLAAVALLALVQTFTTTSAFAWSGGRGGSGVVCRDDAGEIRSVELFDAYEARVRYQIELLPADLTKEATEAVILDRASFSPVYQAEMKAYFAHFDAAVRLISDKDELKKTDDVNAIVISLEPGCKLEQIAVYDDHVLLIRESARKHMSERDLVMLKTHEANFTIQARDVNKQKDSTLARRLTAYEFAARFDSVLMNREVNGLSDYPQLVSAYRFYRSCASDHIAVTDHDYVTGQFELSADMSTLSFHGERQKACGPEVLTATYTFNAERGRWYTSDQDDMLTFLGPNYLMSLTWGILGAVHN